MSFSLLHIFCSGLNNTLLVRSIFVKTYLVKRFLIGSPHSSQVLVGCLAAFSSILLLSGCGRPTITSYKVPKEQLAPHTHETHSPNDGHDHGESAPKIAWTTPKGWEEVAPGEMRAASFRIVDAGKIIDVGIVPLPGLAGKDLDNVNRWRGQVGAEPITEEEMNKLGEPVTVAGQETQLFDQAGENPASGDKTRILAAILRKDGVAWFFKATGDDELVVKNKPAFIEFLKSIQFRRPSALPSDHPPIGGAPANSAATGQMQRAGGPQWEVPGGWQEVPGGQFLVAKFNLPGGQAAVNVSTSTGDGGGVAGNVNRWRKQIGLQDLAPAELEKGLTMLDGPAGKAILVDMSGTDARTGEPTRIIGVVVPLKDETWFYKLMGEPQTVEQEKATFTRFITSAKYPNAR